MNEWLKEPKKDGSGKGIRANKGLGCLELNKKEKDKPKELAKDLLVVAGSVAVLGLGLSLLD